jgi:hypothetical protein
LAAKDIAQLLFGILQYPLPHLRKIFTGAVDVKIQHRHGGLIRRPLAPFAAFSGAFQGTSDFARVM